MYTQTKVTAIVLDDSEFEAITEALDGAPENGDGYPVLEILDEDGELLGSVVWHANTEASELTE